MSTRPPSCVSVDGRKEGKESYSSPLARAPFRRILRFSLRDVQLTGNGSVLLPSLSGVIGRSDARDLWTGTRATTARLRSLSRKSASSTIEESRIELRTREGTSALPRNPRRISETDSAVCLSQEAGRAARRVGQAPARRQYSRPFASCPTLQPTPILLLFCSRAHRLCRCFFSGQRGFEGLCRIRLVLLHPRTDDVRLHSAERLFASHWSRRRDDDARELLGESLRSVGLFSWRLSPRRC